MTSLKLCRQCNKLKPITEFYQNHLYKDGHLNICKDCSKQKSAQQYKSCNKKYWRKYYQKRKQQQQQQTTDIQQALQKLDQILDKLNRL